MSPERTKSDVEVDTRADIYGLGATLYALLTGKSPFAGKTLVEAIAQIRQSDLVPRKKFRLSIPDKFQDVIIDDACQASRAAVPDPPRVVAAPALEQMAKYQGISDWSQLLSLLLGDVICRGPLSLARCRRAPSDQSTTAGSDLVPPALRFKTMFLNQHSPARS